MSKTMTFDQLMKDFDDSLEQLEKGGGGDPKLAPDDNPDDMLEDDDNLLEDDDDDELENGKKKKKKIDDEELMTKSFKAVNENGYEVELVDASQDIADLGARMGNMEKGLNAALKTNAKLMQSLQEGASRQEEFMKSLAVKMTSGLQAISSSPRGRRSTLSVHDKPPIGGTETEGGESINPTEFMAKAVNKFKNKQMTGLELTQCETYLNARQVPPEALMAKVLA